MARPHSPAAGAKDCQSWWHCDRRRSTAMCGTAVRCVADETKIKMAHSERFELLTLGIEIPCWVYLAHCCDSLFTCLSHQLGNTHYGSQIFGVLIVVSSH